MTEDEALSRLIDGDLPAGEAAIWQARVDAEPELAARMAEMEGLLGALDGLEDPAPPVLRLPRRRPSWGWAVAAVAMAALVLLWIRAEPVPPELILARGETVVDGQLSLLAGDRVVDLDGRAAIRVEPPGGVVRGVGSILEGPMDKRHILAGLVGAIVTVTVYEGRAAVGGPSGEVTEVLPGEVKVFAPPAAAPAAPAAPRAERSSALQDEIQRLTDELVAIEGELATERFAGQLVRGRLEAVEGLPSEWHDGVQAALKPEAFEAELVASIAALPTVEVAEVDCSEYPCLAAFRYTGDDDTMAWGDEVMDQVSAWADDNLENASVTGNKSVFRDDGQESRFVLVGVQGDEPEAVKQRTKVRMDELIEALAPESAP